jgi:hypothetical protein
MKTSITFRRSFFVLGALLSLGLSFGTAQARGGIAPRARASYVKRALPSGGHELRKSWQLRNGVKAEHVMQFSKDGHKHLSQRSTRGANGKITYTHTSYNPDGSVTERGRYKVWHMNGVRFSASKDMNAAGKVTYSSQRAKGPTGKTYERSAYGGMVDVEKQWKAKNTTFGIYTRRFVDTGRVSLHRYGAKTR